MLLLLCYRYSFRTPNLLEFLWTRSLIYFEGFFCRALHPLISTFGRVQTRAILAGLKTRTKVRLYPPLEDNYVGKKKYKYSTTDYVGIADDVASADISEKFRLSVIKDSQHILGLAPENAAEYLSQSNKFCPKKGTASSPALGKGRRNKTRASYYVSGGSDDDYIRKSEKQRDAELAEDSDNAEDDDDDSEELDLGDGERDDNPDDDDFNCETDEDNDTSLSREGTAAFRKLTGREKRVNTEGANNGKRKGELNISINRKNVDQRDRSQEGRVGRSNKKNKRQRGDKAVSQDKGLWSPNNFRACFAKGGGLASISDDDIPLGDSCKKEVSVRNIYIIFLLLLLANFFYYYCCY